MKTRSIPDHVNGILDPDSYAGFATITEYTVLKVLGDATKENFCAPYDLTSRSLGKINVKYSILNRDGKNHYFWMFSKSRTAEIPDYYICLGMDEHRTEIVRVWIIPGNSKRVRIGGIFISPPKEERVKQYATDPTIYDKTFQELNIKELPEFRNVDKPKVGEYRYILKKLDDELNRSYKISSFGTIA